MRGEMSRKSLLLAIRMLAHSLLHFIALITKVIRKQLDHKANICPACSVSIQKEASITGEQIRTLQLCFNYCFACHYIYESKLLKKKKQEGLQYQLKNNKQLYTSFQ